MKCLVLGASGATGRLLVAQLLLLGQEVKVIVRSLDNIPSDWKNNERLTLIQAAVTEISKEEMALYLKDCTAVASCLGHNLTWKGIFGKPRRWLTDTVQKLCEAIKSNAVDKPLSFVLMNTAGNRNKDLNEALSSVEKLAYALLRLLLPPFVDNEQAADYLRLRVGQDDAHIHWTVVRPDTLINEEEPSEYELHPSPTRSALFNPGKTSRINVAHFMARLMIEEESRLLWKGRMPVMYNTQR